MTKRIEKQLNNFKYKGEPIRLTVGTLVLTIFCTLLRVIATFTQITFSHFCLPIKNLLLGLPCSPQDYTTVYKYIPQIPVVFFIIALLGRKFGIFSICLYIILGMFLPVFALGGGVKYIFENGFGYILAFIPAAFFTGTLLKIKRDFLRILLMAVLGVLTIHILGVLYMFFIAALKHSQMDLVLGWIITQSGIQIFYDMFFTVIAIYLGRMSRKIFGIIMC